MSRPDVIIIGSGMGGATLAASLAPSGRSILILERGERLKPSPEDRDDVAIFGRGHFRPDEEWLDGEGQAFNPGNYYNVGGNSKFYGAVLIRYREADFSPVQHIGGKTQGWPISYGTLEKWYTKAENLYQVRGSKIFDPTDPPRSSPFPKAAVADEGDVAFLRRKLERSDLTPGTLPLGVDVVRWLAHGQTPWDAFPDTCGGKMDAETVAMEMALMHPNVTLRTGQTVVRLEEGEDHRISAVHVIGPNGAETLCAPVIVLAAGAVNSAALLLKSANDNRPLGLANSSDQVGRNFMNHNCSAVLALHPFRRNRSVYQKTIMVNDYYLTGGPNGEPLGNIQMLGKISASILKAGSALPGPLAQWIANRSFDFYAMSEDLPHPESRVMIKGDHIVLDWRRSNWDAHVLLVKKLKQHLRRAGLPIVLSKPFDRRTPSHQCGTARMGSDPKTSVVDIFGRSHDHSNLFVADASVLPSSAAVNPALTIAALAMRTANHILEKDLAA